MTTHEFHIGDIVVLRPHIGNRDETAYEVTRIMPGDGPIPVYRLKGVNTPRERVAQEHELRHATGESAPEGEEAPRNLPRMRPERRRQ